MRYFVAPGSALVVLLAARLACAEGGSPAADATAKPVRGFYLGIASGQFFPIEKWPSRYTFGGGGDFIGGYQVSEHWALQLDSTMWLLSGGGLDTWDLKVTPQVKADIGPWRLKPIVSAGAGLDYQLDEPSGTSIVRPVLTLAAGAQYEMRPGCRVFVEGIGYLVLGTVTTQDIPLVAGMSVVF
jgi:hypothetical protein